MFKHVVSALVVSGVMLSGAAFAADMPAPVAQTPATTQAPVASTSTPSTTQSAMAEKTVHKTKKHHTAKTVKPVKATPAPAPTN
ncbi:MAG TPA: hypothetical protein VK558_00970 [Patescibacteria group bacterium]|nr:hypothetical protein [Patescibacteria group bacterium]